MMPSEMTLRVRLRTSRFGTKAPRVEVVAPKGADPRRVTAALHMVAARLELAMPPRTGWVVTLDADLAAVSLELLTDTDDEVAEAMGLLKSVFP